MNDHMNHFPEPNDVNGDDKVVEIIIRGTSMGLRLRNVKGFRELVNIISMALHSLSSDDAPSHLETAEACTEEESKQRLKEIMDFGSAAGFKDKGGKRDQ